MHLLTRLRSAQQLPSRRRLTKVRARCILLSTAGILIMLLIPFCALIGIVRRSEHPLAPEIRTSAQAPVDGDTVSRAAAIARAALENSTLAEENSIAQSMRSVEKDEDRELEHEDLSDSLLQIDLQERRRFSPQKNLGSLSEENHLHNRTKYKTLFERGEAIWKRNEDGTVSYVGSSTHASKQENEFVSREQAGENASIMNEKSAQNVQLDKKLSSGTEQLSPPLHKGDLKENNLTLLRSTTRRLNREGRNNPLHDSTASSNEDYFGVALKPGTRGSFIDGINSEGGYTERLTTRDFGVAFGIAVAHSAVVVAGEREHLSRHVIVLDEAYRRLVRTGKLGALVTRYADALENAAAGSDESLVYVRNHKLYAARSLPAGTVLGEYGGRYMRSSQVASREYWWDLPEMRVNGKQETWGVDASEWGNALRFCNDLGPGSWNIEMKYVPWNGHWHVVYETLSPVLENEELSISFGANYWAAKRS